MSILSLVGKWKLIRDGSDFMPGLDNLRCSPIVLKLLGKAETEFIKIEKRKLFEADEIALTYVTKSLSVGCAFQLGTLNFECVTTPSETIFGIVQNCNEKFTEFTILRLGPGCGQMSREVYTLDIANNEIKLEIEVNSGDGLHIKLVKYLTRFDASQVSQEVVFKTCAMTQGWSRHEFWPSSVFADCKILIVKAVKIMTCNTKTMQDNKVLNVLWTRKGFTDDFKLNLNSLAHNQVLRQKDGEEIIIFCVQVTMNGVTWYVAHRYTEFSVLKGFLMQQNPSTAEFKTIQQKFPGKAIGIAYRKSVLERRVEGLGAFLVYFLQNARLCKQTSVDAVCSFLAIPEHLAVLLKGDNRAPAPARDPATAASLTSAAAAAATRAPAGGYGASAVAPGKTTGVAAVTGGGAGTVSGLPGASTPAQRLWALLGKKGMTVIKHGRQGAPKQRVLHCAPDATLLYWGDKSSYKSVFLDEVREIRLGTDIDPATPAHLIPASAAQGSQAAADRAKRGINRAMAMKAGVLYGTETLRRTCKADDLALCFSLILPTRTFDIQCKTLEDLEKLLAALRDVCPPPLALNQEEV